MTADVITKKLFTIDEFHLMGEVGILPRNSRHELIRGEIIEMSPIGSPHAGRVKRLLALFTSRLGPSVIVSIQDPVILNRYSEPLPDVVLLRPRTDFYTNSHPTPHDVLLVVEVADTSVRWDRNVKAPLYAESGIGTYWVLDINDEVLNVYSSPENGAYLNVASFRRSDNVQIPQFPEIIFTVDEILGESSPDATSH